MARIVIATPHPSMDWVHGVGAVIGLFNKYAKGEYEELLDRPKLEMAGSNAGLLLVTYQRLLFGADHIEMYK